jgi:hypothetical protein
MIKYSVRSYAHWNCLLKRKSLEDGLAWLRGLHSHEVRNAPVLIVQNWLEARGWKGERSMELLLSAAKDANRREARP